MGLSDIGPDGKLIHVTLALKNTAKSNVANSSVTKSRREGEIGPSEDGPKVKKS